jgi:hypothetical protein
MLNTRTRDIVGGLLLVVLGIFTMVYSHGRYDPGTLFQVGPGAFPLALGLLMLVFGVAVFVGAFFLDVSTVTVRIRPIFFVSAALAGFALTIERFGLVPAVILVVVLSSFAEERPLWREVPILTGALLLITVVVFKYGLAMTMPLFRW